MTRDLVVRVARDPSGHVYSEVWDKTPSLSHDSVVIDRQNGRNMSQSVIISRACPGNAKRREWRGLSVPRSEN